MWEHSAQQKISSQYHPQISIFLSATSKSNTLNNKDILKSILSLNLSQSLTWCQLIKDGI